ncbi:MAG: hypothetical protein MJ230_01280 [bacterium]|nr:hypothetical protein [bacterium]
MVSGISILNPNNNMTLHCKLSEKDFVSMSAYKQTRGRIAPGGFGICVPKQSIKEESPIVVNFFKKLMDCGFTKEHISFITKNIH